MERQTRIDDARRVLALHWSARDRAKERLRELMRELALAEFVESFDPASDRLAETRTFAPIAAIEDQIRDAFEQLRIAFVEIDIQARRVQSLEIGWED